MKNYSKRLTLFALSGLLLFGSCNNFSRDKAKDLVLKNLRSKELVIQFNLRSNGRIEKEPRFDKEYVADALIEKGYMKQGETKYHVNLTDKIQPFIRNSGNSTMGHEIWVVVASFKDVEITGITGDDKNKKVEFNTIYELNALGKEIGYNGDSRYIGTRISSNGNGDIVINGQEKHFEKYDDGWR